jgi:hypothetical protein
MIVMVLWIIAIVVGTSVGTSRGHGFAGFLLSFCLAWLGVAIVLLLPRKPHTPSQIVNIHNEVMSPPSARKEDK